MTKLDCEAALNQLHDYLKQELTPDLAREIKQHLERCKPCFAHAQFEASFLSVVQSRGRSKTCPREVRTRILAALAALRAEVKEH